MANSADRSIIGYFVHSGDVASFKDVNGNTGTTKALTNANFVASDTFFVGADPNLSITLSGDLSHGATSAKVILERKRIDKNNSSLFNWAVIGTTRGDKAGTAAASSQTIASADFTGQSVSTNADGSAPATETLDVVLLTTDERLAGECRVIVETTGATGSGDKLIVAVEAA